LLHGFIRRCEKKCLTQDSLGTILSKITMPYTNAQKYSKTSTPD
jgi:hypothetical protein